VDLPFYVDPGTVPIHERPSSKSMTHVMQSRTTTDTSPFGLDTDSGLTRNLGEKYLAPPTGSREFLVQR